MDKNLDLTIIIPLNKWSEEVKDYLDRAVDSIALSTVKPSKVIFVVSSIIENDFIPYSKKTFEELKTLGIDTPICYPTEKTDFCEQINQIVKEVDTKYFSILEYTDYYGKTWLENVEKHINLNKEISMYLPIVNVYNEPGDFLRFYNEQYWAQGFTSNDLGFITEDALKVLWDMNISGGIINTQDFIELGSLKPSIKLYYWYEFMLRFCNQKKTAYVIPKSLYNHILFKQEMEADEAKFYYDLCSKEYWYKEDRNKTYIKK